jgi:23S rRNA (adenine2503-C2)-methyltransferase
MDKSVNTNLKDMSMAELVEVAETFGKKPYSGRQLYKWLFRQGVANFDDMTDLSKDFRSFLNERYTIGKLRKIETIKSRDGSSKTIWATVDNQLIESVIIPDADRLTLCMSSQAGCPLNCSFCATGKLGFKRNLSSGEIYDQYLLTQHECAQMRLELPPESKITNIVFMGMGEPFLNYNNLLRAIDNLTDQLGAGLAARKITVSTVGLVDGIYKLADDNPRPKLAISLHSAIEDKRLQLIPIAKKYPLSELKQAAIYYADKSENRVTFEYLLIKGINDGIEDARALAEFIRGISCKINLISYNPVDNLNYERPDDRAIESFRDYLLPRAPAVTVRKSRGDDIAAACGQLAAKRIKSI